MTKDEYKIWVKEIKEKLPGFLLQMNGKHKKGFYNYSLSGDIFSEKFNWGLGNSVFVLKIYRSLNLIPENLPEITDFIQNFQKPGKEFYDPIIKYASFPVRVYTFLKEQDKNRLNHKFIRRAETRQAISALKLFNIEPEYEYKDFPQTEKDIELFLENLNWKIPWGAGSHFSALMFFLAVSKLDNKLELIHFAVNHIEKYRQKDGCWYKDNPSLQLKINGAMKIITGLKAAASLANYNNGKVVFDKVNELINTSLQATNDKNACSNFNLIYTLRYANELSEGNYRYNEIEEFIMQRLDIYKQFYFEKYGAFSFLKNKSNSKYYGAVISKGKNEPDIHGTVMFLWGLAVIGNFWGINDEVGLFEFIT